MSLWDAKKLDKTYLTWFIVFLFNCSTEWVAIWVPPLREERAVNIFSTSAMKDSATLTRPHFLSSLACFLRNCHTTACPSRAITNLPRAQVLHHRLGGELEAA
jgi:hypothetical protein